MGQIIGNGLKIMVLHALWMLEKRILPITTVSDGYLIAQNLLMGCLYNHTLITVVRLDFCRPTPDTFHLVVLNSDIGDNGSYQCRVKLDCKGQWNKLNMPNQA